MKIARYWARSTGEMVVARGWSDESVDAARVRAREIARRVSQRVAAQDGGAPRYPYGDRPLPEPILSEIRDDENLSAVITRNSYGSMVMNAAQMMFVDIDRQNRSPDLQSTVKSLFSSLFGKPASGPAQAVDTVVEGARQVAEGRRLSARMYRTAAGYRVLITNRRYAAKSAESEMLLSEFGSDPLYVRLCGMQESFRARLTPKPWRVDVAQPPVTFPFETAEAQARYRAWEREYETASSGFATCWFVTSFGIGGSLPEFEGLIRLHDEKTRASSGLPLA